MLDSAFQLLQLASTQQGSWPAFLPPWEEIVRIFSLRDYNTRVVLTGVTLLGAACGVVGSFMLLSKRALLGDALSHATLPGVALAFLVSVSLGGTGKSLPILLLGASISAVIGVLTVMAIRRYTRIKEDAAMGIVLSVFFGLGVAVLGVAQRTGQGNSAGLESFIYGKAASMTAFDASLIAWVSLFVVVLCLVLYKEFKLLCFDAAFASVQGWPSTLLTLTLMGLTVLITVAGLQAVGLVLVIAMLIIPSAAARFWTKSLSIMIVIAACIGAFCGMAGAGLSALYPRAPSGALIVLMASLCFVISMMVGPSQGVLIRWIRRGTFERKVARQHLLRAIYELTESGHTQGSSTTESEAPSATVPQLLRLRSWSARELRRLIAWTKTHELVIVSPDQKLLRLSPRGLATARQLVREHRLWEMYLITYADIAPSHVDRDADAIEHVLSPELIEELELLVSSSPAQRRYVSSGDRPVVASDVLLKSPHTLDPTH